MEDMSMKEILEKTAKNMKRWQKIEKSAVRQTAMIQEQTTHPLIRMVAEIIQNDSQMHYRVQQLISDSLESKQVNIDPRQISKVWTLVQEHIELEKKTIRLAQKSLKDLEGSKYPIQQYLLEYLQMDEEKHEKLLENLDLIKRKMYPY
jgi:hypothetical protein